MTATTIGTVLTPNYDQRYGNWTGGNFSGGVLETVPFTPLDATQLARPAFDNLDEVSKTHDIGCGKAETNLTDNLNAGIMSNAQALIQYYRETAQADRDFVTAAQKPENFAATDWGESVRKNALTGFPLRAAVLDGLAEELENNSSYANQVNGISSRNELLGRQNIGGWLTDTAAYNPSLLPTAVVTLLEVGWETTVAKIKDWFGLMSVDHSTMPLGDGRVMYRYVNGVDITDNAATGEYLMVVPNTNGSGGQTTYSRTQTGTVNGVPQYDIRQTSTDAQGAETFSFQGKQSGADGDVVPVKTISQQDTDHNGTLDQTTTTTPGGVGVTQTEIDTNGDNIPETHTLTTGAGVTFNLNDFNDRLSAEGWLHNAVEQALVFDDWGVGFAYDTAQMAVDAGVQVFPVPNPDPIYEYPLGAFYDSQSAIADNSSSIAAYTPRVLDAANHGLTEIQLAGLDTESGTPGVLTVVETANLKLWRDTNENGHIDSGELAAVSSPIAAADYAFYTQGNGKVGTGAPIETAPAQTPPVSSITVAQPDKANLIHPVPDSNYRTLRDSDNIFYVPGGSHTWKATEIKINYNNQSYFIGTDGNDINVDATFFATYPQYFNISLLTNFLAGGGNDGMGGSSRNDNLWGGTGNDTLMGYAGDDHVYGEAGVDILHGQDGNDTLDGGADADTLYGGVGNDVLNGGDGDDALVDYTGDDTLFGGDGMDELQGGAGNDKLLGEAGNDKIFGQVGNDILWGGADNDILVGFTRSNEAKQDLNPGETDDDILYGEAGNDKIFGQVGNDTLWGGAGNDILVGFTMGDEAKQGLNPGETDDNILYGEAGIDNLFGGVGNDLLDGGADNDLLYGRTGNDTLYGGVGSDELHGDEGNDQLLSGSDDDKLFGQVGNDTLWGGDGNDQILGFTASNEAKQSLDAGETDDDILVGGAGSDILMGGLGQDMLFGGTDRDELQGGVGNDLLYGEEGNDNLFGQAGDDVLYGGDGDDYLGGFTASNEAQQVLNPGETDDDKLYGGKGTDTLSGGVGNDYLDGGAEADVMVGGADNDIYIVNSVNDTVYEQANEGYDTVIASTNYLLNAEVEELRLLEGFAIHGTGNAQNNKIIGNSADNILDGVNGADTMIGSAGNDTYYVDNIGDQVEEHANEGTDTVQSSIDCTLGTDVENLILLDFSKPEMGLVNQRDVLVYGYPKRNELDYMQGDAVAGYEGTCALTAIANLLTLAGRPTTESEVVTLAIENNWAINDLSLPAYQLGGSDVAGQQALLNAQNARNDVRHVYNEAALENLLRSGRVVLVAVNAGALWSDDRFRDDGVNHLVTLTGASYFADDGSLAGFYIADSGRGLVSDMTRYVDIATFRQAAEDVSNPYFIYTIDPVKLWSENIDGTGNDGANKLIGNRGDNALLGLAGADLIEGDAGNDTLDGGTGADTLIGGSGDDTYLVDNAGDVVTEADGADIDTVHSSINYALGANVENLVLLPGAAYGWGNAANNVLTGNAGNNLLDGQVGADTLIGGQGNDTYWVDDANDVVVEAIGGGDFDTVKSSQTYTIGANVEVLVLTGHGAISGTATNASGAYIYGNDAGNVLTGSTGKDVLDGGAGNDTYFAGNGDIIIDADGSGKIYFDGVALSALIYSPTGQRPSGADYFCQAAGTLTKGLKITNATGESITILNWTQNALGITASGYNDPVVLDLNHDGIINAIASSQSQAYFDFNYDGIGERTGWIAPGDGFLAQDWNQNGVIDDIGELFGSNHSDGFTDLRARLDSNGNGAVESGDAEFGTLSVWRDANGDGYSQAGELASLAQLGISRINLAAVATSLSAADNIITGTSSFTQNGLTYLAADINLAINFSLTNAVRGASGSTSVTGTAGNDVIIGTSSSDMLDGGAGNDRYLFGRNDGWDTISNNDATVGKRDVIRFKSDVAPDGVTLSRVGDDLLLAVVTTSDGPPTAGQGLPTRITAKDYFVNDGVGPSSIQAIEFEWEAAWTFDNVKSLLPGPTYNDDILIGYGTDDTISGLAGNDTLDGRAGADLLLGGAGNDTYVVDSSGDAVVEYANEGDDTVLAAVSYDLSALPNVENVVLTGTAGTSAIGNAADNRLVGNAGSNYIDGNGGADTLDGGAGIDSLYGGADNDTYVLNRGTGADFASDSYGVSSGGKYSYWTPLDAGADTLRVGADVADVELEMSGASLVVGLREGGVTGAAGQMSDRMTLQGWDDPLMRIETIEFADGSRHPLADWRVGTAGNDNLTATVAGARMYGGGGADVLYGINGAETLDGGTGNDLLVGGAGNDSYVFNRGSGADLVQDYDATAGNVDKASFGAGIATDQLWFRHVGNDLEASIIGTTDKLTIQNWYSGSANHVEQFKTADGKLLLDSQVENLVQAMAAFAPPAAGQTTLPAPYQTTLAPVLAANWQ